MIPVLLAVYVVFWFALALTEGAGGGGGTPFRNSGKRDPLQKILADPKFQTIRAHSRDN